MMKTMKNIEFPRLGSAAVIAGLCLLGLGGVRATAATAQRPNVLIITTDQQRVDAMSAVGNKWVKTPHMDSIAANGVYFRNSRTKQPCR